jgi:uncharacterized protein (DUF433 family)
MMKPSRTTESDPSLTPTMRSLSQEHIVSTPDTCGGKPRIVGHRIRVQDVVLWHETMGMSPEEVVSEYPGLTLADVHAALAYYHDHKAEVGADLRQEEARATELERSLPSLSGLTIAGRDAKDNPIPSR